MFFRFMTSCAVKYRTVAGLSTMPAPRSSIDVAVRSNTSTSHPASRSHSAAFKPPSEPPATMARSWDLAELIVRCPLVPRRDGKRSSGAPDRGLWAHETESDDAGRLDLVQDGSLAETICADLAVHRKRRFSYQKA